MTYVLCSELSNNVKGSHRERETYFIMITKDTSFSSNQSAKGCTAPSWRYISCSQHQFGEFCGCVCSKVQSALCFMQLSWHIITYKAYFCCGFWICFSLVVHIPLFCIKVLNIGLRLLSRPCKFWKYFLIQGRYLSVNIIIFCWDNFFHFLQKSAI